MQLTPETTLRITAKCPHCEKGVVANPVWLEFNEAVRKGETTPDKMEGWFNERGFTTKRNFMGSTYMALPSEEIPCCECEGSGWVTTNTTLADLKVFILEGIKPN
jgi:hypothetical protein